MTTDHLRRTVCLMAAVTAAISFQTDAFGEPVPVTFTCCAPGASEVFVSGTFNGWSPAADRMSDEDADGIFVRTIDLEPGRYEYRFVVDGESILDPNARLNVPDGSGGRNSLLLVFRDEPSAMVRFSFRAPEGTEKVYLAGTFNEWESTDIPLVKEQGDSVFRAEIYLPAGEYQYKFIVDGNWRADPRAAAYTDDGFGGRNSLLQINASAATEPPPPPPPLESSAGEPEEAEPEEAAPEDTTPEEPGNGGSEAPEEDLFSAVDRVLESLAQADIAFNTPEELEVDEEADIELLLSPSIGSEELGRMIEEEGEIVEARIRVSNQMEARLTGQNFSIQATTPERQAVSYSEVTGWKWSIIPRSPGSLRLHLTLCAFIEVDGEVTPRSIKVFDRIIDVRLAPVSASRRVLDFIGRNWQWLWAALLVPIAGWLFRRLRSSKKQKNT